ncbi:MAG: response regulator transcription factor [Caldimonas sp.]
MKALLIDDHPLILSALENVIQGLCPDATLVSVETAQQARAALAADPAFDLALLDLHLGEFDGFELLAELRTAYPSLSIVVISASDRSADIFRAIELGAMGFVPKRASNELLSEALSMVISGGIYVPPMALRSFAAGKAGARDDQEWHARLNDGVVGPPSAQSLRTLGFTPRQTEVLGLLLRGQSNKLIARELNLSVETIKDHVAAVIRTLKVSSRTQAVLAVSRMLNPGALPARGDTPRAEARSS